MSSLKKHWSYFCTKIDIGKSPRNRKPESKAMLTLRVKNGKKCNAMAGSTFGREKHKQTDFSIDMCQLPMSWF